MQMRHQFIFQRSAICPKTLMHFTISFDINTILHIEKISADVSDLSTEYICSI